MPPRPPGIPVLKVKNSPPPLSVKIPENSRYENTAYKQPIRRLCKPKGITIAIYLPITN